MQTLYTAVATATGGRDGRAVSNDQILDVKLATPRNSVVPVARRPTLNSCSQPVTRPALSVP